MLRVPKTILLMIPLFCGVIIGGVIILSVQQVSADPTTVQTSENVPQETVFPKNVNDKAGPNIDIVVQPNTTAPTAEPTQTPSTPNQPVQNTGGTHTPVPCSQ
jgi:hypothetical protein